MAIVAADSGEIARRLRTDTSGRLYVLVTDGTETATVTADGYLDVKTHPASKCFSADYAEAQTNVTIITPSAGKKIQIARVYVSTASTDVNVTISFVTSGNILFKLYTSKTNLAADTGLCAVGAANESVKITCGAGTFVSIGYEEIT